MPFFEQLFVSSSMGRQVALGLDRLAFCLRKRAEREAEVYFASLSSRTIVYKGMLTTGQLEPFFPDLSDPRFATELALVHSRFSTNTFPSWPLAHPYRIIAHNGEINTVKGNRNWMRARESQLTSDIIPGDLERIFPICTPDASDSASFDEVLELLHLGGRSLPHAVLMMIPEAWENHATMDPARKAFYEFHSTFMEPWDGPANVCFTDGTLVGAVLDRNGLRPGRYAVTDDGLVVLASESGVIELDPAHVVQRGRLQPGKMFLVDTEHGRIVSDEEIKSSLAAAKPYAEWLHAGLIRMKDLPEREHIVHTAASVQRRQQTFGYTSEDLRILLTPMAKSGAEALGSMGTDTPIAVLSSRPRLLFDYFTQLFAQVTNPPLDAIREELVTSLGTFLGPEGNALSASPAHARQLVLDFPVIDNDELAKIVHINADGDLPGYATHVVRGLYDVTGGAAAMRDRLEEIFAEVSQAIRRGARFVVLSDRDSGRDLAPIPSLLLTAAVHHHLIREKTRTQVGMIVEAGDVREVHHVALLIGFGAAAVNPYLAMETVEDLVRSGEIEGVESEQAVRNLIKALGKGVLKVMSKMGISTVASYRGAQVFEAIGLSQELVDRYFTGTVSQLGGVGLDVIARETAERHARAYPPDGVHQAHRVLEVGGEYQWRREGEPHLFDPDTVFRLQHSTRQRRYDIFKQYTGRIDDQTSRLMTLRGLMALQAHGCDRPAARAARGGRAGQRDRQALQHRRDELRLDLEGGARDARDRDEPPRRPLQHRRGRRGRRPPARPRAALRGQAGRLRPLRRDEPLPHPLRRHPDQDGPGRQARRGRPAARAQGLPVGGQDAALDAGGRPDLAAAAPRHLLDRGPRPAHPRPQERQPRRRASTSSSSPRSASARWPRACPRRTPTSCSSRATTAAPAPRRSRRSSTPGRRGSSAWPRPSRPSCSTGCATASSCRSTVSSRPAATSSWRPCSAPRSSASRPPRSSSRAAS